MIVVRHLADGGVEAVLIDLRRSAEDHELGRILDGLGKLEDLGVLRVLAVRRIGVVEEEEGTLAARGRDVPEGVEEAGGAEAAVHVDQIESEGQLLEHRLPPVRGPLRLPRLVDALRLADTILPRHRQKRRDHHPRLARLPHAALVSARGPRGHADGRSLSPARVPRLHLHSLIRF